MNRLLIALIAVLTMAGIIGGVWMVSNNQGTVAANTPEANDLAGTSWILEQITDADGARPVLEGSQITLDFIEDNRVAGNATCNRYMGSYSQDGASLSFSPLASTMMACIGEGMNEQEMAFLSAMGSVEQAAVNGDTLILSDADGVKLQFVRA